jgi:hypothetical protein
MQRVGSASDRSGVFWCARCGTLKIVSRDEPESVDAIGTPMLVERVRRLGGEAAETEGCFPVCSRMRILGIYESIYTPNARPQ